MDLSLINGGLVFAVLLAISLGALLKGMTGMGLPMFAVPALATMTSVENAVVLMIIPGIAANLWLVVTHRRYARLLKEHLPFLVCGFAGGFFGTWLLQVTGDRMLKILLATWLGVYLVQYFMKKEPLGMFGANPNAGYPLGFAAGTIQGATGISAQVVAPYFYARGLLQQPYAFAVAFAFLILGGSQLAGAASFDLFTMNRIQLSLLALIPTLVFTWVGTRMSHKLSADAFRRILLVTFVLMEVKLIVDIL